MEQKPISVKQLKYLESFKFHKEPENKDLSSWQAHCKINYLVSLFRHIKKPHYKTKSHIFKKTYSKDNEIILKCKHCAEVRKVVLKPAEKKDKTLSILKKVLKGKPKTIKTQDSTPPTGGSGSESEMRGEGEIAPLITPQNPKDFKTT